MRLTEKPSTPRYSVPSHFLGSSRTCPMAGWKAYLILLPIFAVIDLTYLGVIMKGFYDREMGELARRVDGNFAPRLGASLIVYLLIPAGIILFARSQLAAH